MRKYIIPLGIIVIIAIAFFAMYDTETSMEQETVEEDQLQEPVQIIEEEPEEEIITEKTITIEEQSKEGFKGLYPYFSENEFTLSVGIPLTIINPTGNDASLHTNYFIFENGDKTLLPREKTFISKNGGQVTLTFDVPGEVHIKDLWSGDLEMTITVIE